MKLTGHLIANLIRLNGAHVLAKYASEFYAGSPAVTLRIPIQREKHGMLVVALIMLVSVRS